MIPSIVKIHIYSPQTYIFKYIKMQKTPSVVLNKDAWTRGLRDLKTLLNLLKRNKSKSNKSYKMLDLFSSKHHTAVYCY